MHIHLCICSDTLLHVAVVAGFRLPGAQVVFSPNTIKSLFTETAHEANIRPAETTTEVGETL